MRSMVKVAKELQSLKFEDFERAKLPEGQMPPLQQVNGAVINRPAVRAIRLETEADGDWLEFGCSARGWNSLDIPDDWDDVLFYATGISWNNGNVPVNELGVPGDGRALLISGARHVHVFVTSISADQPQRMFGLAGMLWSATADSWDGDNSGGYIIKVKKRVA